jgi:hypothetical protein
LGAVLIERCQAALKLGLLDGRQLHLVVVQAVPKLRDERKPFIRREAGDFVTRELHRSSLPEAKGGDNGASNQSPILDHRWSGLLCRAVT